MYISPNVKFQPIVAFGGLLLGALNLVSLTLIDKRVRDLESDQNSICITVNIAYYCCSSSEKQHKNIKFFRHIILCYFRQKPLVTQV